MVRACLCFCSTKLNRHNHDQNKTNPAKQWNAERVEYRKDGEFLKEMVISLRRRDGIWFPDVVTLRRGPQREVVQTWVIESATFNRPARAAAVKPPSLATAWNDRSCV